MILWQLGKDAAFLQGVAEHSDGIHRAQLQKGGRHGRRAAIDMCTALTRHRLPTANRYWTGNDDDEDDAPLSDRSPRGALGNARSDRSASDEIEHQPHWPHKRKWDNYIQQRHNMRPQILSYIQQNDRQDRTSSPRQRHGWNNHKLQWNIRNHGGNSPSADTDKLHSDTRHSTCNIRHSRNKTKLQIFTVQHRSRSLPISRQSKSPIRGHSARRFDLKRIVHTQRSACQRLQSTLANRSRFQYVPHSARHASSRAPNIAAIAVDNWVVRALRV